jgi:hypothetical protein
VGMGSCPHNLFVHVITFLSHFLQTSPWSSLDLLQVR